MNVIIPVKLWQQLRYWLKAGAPNSIIALGALDQVDPEHWRAIDLKLPHQYTTPEFSRIEMNSSTHRFLYDPDVKSPAFIERNALIVHGHNTDKPPRWSAPEESDIERWPGSHLVCLVINARGDFYARTEIFQPIRVQRILTDIVIEPEEDPELEAACASEVKQQVHPAASSAMLNHDH